MSRASTSSQRNLTLTEELEKLEQSITLTLQEIDHNFSRAHRIVTTSILPIVEQYAEHSKNVWEGSKFWKQFFEASANVSLSGYEETPPEDATLTTTSTEDITATTPSSSTYPSPHAADLSPSNQPYNNDSTSSFYSPQTHSTPRPHNQPTLATYSSPYETLRRETLGPTTSTSPPHSPSPSHSVTELPSTPRNLQHTAFSSSSSPQSSPFLPPSTAATLKGARTPADDLLLHRVLDKNYRLQATPHTQTRLPRYGINTNTTKNVGATPQTTHQRQGTARTERTRYVVPEELDSSPIAPAPEIRTHMFSPAKGKRVPGVSVLTPAKGVGGLGKGGAGGMGKDTGRGRGGRNDIWDSDSDDDGLPEGMSPPKTMQFYIPQSKLLKTPAREASKKIVEGLLCTAGGDVTEDFEEDLDSPSIVRKGLGEEDTF